MSIIYGVDLTNDASGIVAPSGDSSSAATSTAPTSDTAAAPIGQSNGQDTTSTVQGQSSPTPTTESDDALADVPSLDEINQLPDDAKFKKSLLQMRNAIEDRFKPQLAELTSKYDPFKSHIERFEKPEALDEIVKFNDALFGVERDERGQLVPSTQTFANDLAARDPNVADFLAADLMNGMTRSDDGRQIPRIELALEAMAQDPNRRAAALRILGGVEPTSIAPQWQPSADELAVVAPELQDIYRKLPYDEREALKLNDPSFINTYLGKEKFQADLIAANQQAQQLQAQQTAQRDQYVAQQAAAAGNKYVEDQFRAGFTEFANSVVEKTQFIGGLDPEVAKSMPPEQVAAYTQQAQQINQGVGKMIATVTAALSHPDTQWIAADFLKSLGVDDSILAAFNTARTEFANNARNYGELAYQSNGSGHAGLGTLQANASRAMREMKGRGNAVAQPLMQMMSKFFEMKAGNYNSTLNGAATARPPTNGSRFDPTTAPAQLPVGGTLSRAEIERLYG